MQTHPTLAVSRGSSSHLLRNRTEAGKERNPLRSPEPRWARGGKGKGSTAYGRAHFRKGQGLTAQGRSHTLSQMYSKEGSRVLLTGSLQAVSESTTALDSESLNQVVLSVQWKAHQTGGWVHCRKSPALLTGQPTDRPAKRPRIDQV